MAKIERVLTDDEIEGLFLGELKKEEVIKNPEESRVMWTTFDTGRGYHDAAWDRPTYELNNSINKFRSPEGFTEEQLQDFFEKYTEENTEPQESPNSEETATLGR